MTNTNRWAASIACILMLSLASCSGGGSSGGDSASGESKYDPGASVGALSFSESRKVELFQVDRDGSSVAVHDGDYLEPGTKKLAIKVDGDPSNIERVFVSDGGAFQIEAFPKDGRYLCEYPISNDELYQVILVKVFHSSGRASKEKIVVKTGRSFFGEGYTKNAIGILISQDILDGQTDGLSVLLDDKVGAVISTIAADNASLITELRYGDNDPATNDLVINSLEAVRSEAYPSAVIHMNFTVKNITFSGLPLFGQDFIRTQGNNLTIDTYAAVRDVNAKGEVRLVLDFLGSAQAVFSKPFFFQGYLEDMIEAELEKVDMPPIALGLEDKGDDLKSSLPSHLMVNGYDVDVSRLVSGLNNNLEKYLFVDAYGIPESGAQGVLALGLGLCVEDYDDIEWGAWPAGPGTGQFDMEETFTGLFQSATDSTFAEIRQKNQGLVINLSYGDGNPSTDDVVVNSLVLASTSNPNIKTATMDFTVRMVDLDAISLFGFPVISTYDNDLDIQAVFTIEYRETGGGTYVVVSTQSVSSVDFEKIFIGILSVQGMIRQELLGMEEKSYVLSDILSDFDLGIDMARAFSQPTYPVFPDATPLLQNPGWGLELLDTYNLRFAVAQNSMNWLLEDLAGEISEWDVKEMLIPILGKSFPGFAAGGSADEATVLCLNVPPVIDLRNSRIRVIIPDAVIQYRLSGVPQWEVSIDIDVTLTPVAEGDKLNFYVTPTTGQNHFHVMKDNRGNLGIFDHSALTENTIRHLPEMLGENAGGPVASMSLNAMGAGILFKSIADPVKVSASGGYLYIDIAASSVDLMKYVELFK